MSDRAKVTSLEVIESFRAKLIVYREKAARVLDEVSDEVTRTRLWLAQDRPAYWQNHLRRCARDLEAAQQELFSARLSGLRDASYAQQAAVQRLRREIRDAEEKLKMVKQWQRQFDTRVESPARQVEKLRHFLGHDVNRAVAYLNETLKNLTAYTELSPPPAALANSAENKSESIANPPASPASPDAADANSGSWPP